MACPTTFQELQNLPCFVINMDKDANRFEQCKTRLDNAGFTNVLRWRAVDGNIKDELAAGWAMHGNPSFDATDARFMDTENSGFKQGIMLSHMGVWKHMITNDVPWAIIWEDDVVFHKDWASLAPAYFDATPKDYDLLYMGHHCGCGKPFQILKVPVFCCQAMVVSLDGIKTLYSRILNEPNGIRTLDCLIYEFMVQTFTENKPFCNWYAWNAEMFPDETVSKHPQHAHKDTGLVFQEYIQERTHH